MTTLTKAAVTTIFPVKDTEGNYLCAHQGSH